MDKPTPKLRASSATVREAETMRISLELLSALDANASVTQRTLASEVGVALGLVNSYLRRCVKTGLVKARAVPRRRIAYYLTQQGFSEKSRLAADYLYYSLDFFRRARASCEEVLNQAERSNIKLIALSGASDLAEIMVVCALGRKVRLVCVVDDQTDATNLAGLPVRRDLAEVAGEVDAVVVTSIANAAAIYDEAVRVLGAGRVLLPGILEATARPVPATSESDER